MAEHKPKHDDQMVADAKSNMPHPSKDPRPHGDKLQHALDEASKKTSGKRHR